MRFPLRHFQCMAMRSMFKDHLTQLTDTQEIHKNASGSIPLKPSWLTRNNQTIIELIIVVDVMIIAHVL